MRLMTLLVRRSYGACLLAAFLGALGGGTTVALLAVVNRILQEGAYSSREVLAFAGLCVVRLAGSGLSHVLIVRLSADATHDISLLLVRRILHAPLLTLEEIGPHRLLAAFSKDVGTLADIVLTIPYQLVNLIIVIGCLVYIGLCSWQVFLGIALLAMLGVASFSLPVLCARRSFYRGREETDSLFKHYRSLIEGIKELKLHRFRQHTFVHQVVMQTASLVREHMVRAVTIYALASHWNRLLFFIYVGLLMFVLPMFVAVEVPALGAYVLVLLYMMAPLEAIQNALPNISQANIAMKKLDGLGLSLGAEPIGAKRPLERGDAPRGNAITMEAVTYSYRARGDDNGFTLGPITLTLRRGELVFLVGGNGSGKTTLMKVLTGLYRPHTGHIRLDEMVVTDENLESYREQFTAVFQDFWVFESLWGLEENPQLDDEANRWIDVLKLRDQVHVVNGDLSTVDLSRGQRKRLALLTALLEDRPFCVFDEWAADQDPTYKEVFYQEILPQLKRRGKAVLVITHDDRYWHIADRAIKLESGSLCQAELALESLVPGRVAARGISRLAGKPSQGERQSA
jgi:putative ATP-binding cassette transporter